MELLSSLSNHSNNSVAEMMNMQFEFVWGLKNGLERMFEKEAKEREKQEKEAQKSQHIPSFSSALSSAKSMIGSFPH